MVDVLLRLGQIRGKVPAGGKPVVAPDVDNPAVWKKTKVKKRKN